MLAALGLTVAGILTECASPEQEVSTTLTTRILPYLGASSVFAEVRDWRRLTRPSAAVRSYFESMDATYRVISAQPDRVSLAVWQTDSPAAQPFDGGVRATGHGCVTLTRPAHGRVRSRVHACPSHLGPGPGSFPTSWGRDSDALQIAQSTFSGVVSDLTWLMNRDAGGQPRHSVRTAAQVLTAVRASSPPPGGRLAIATVLPRRPGRLRATLVATGTATDPVDTHRRISARTCATLQVVLAENATGISLTPVTCR